MPAISGVTDGAQGREPLRGKLNVKIGLNLAYISVFSILLVSSRLLLFAIFGVFSGDFVF